MSPQDDKVAGPEPDEDAKRKAADMVRAYEDRPTLVLPGSGGMVSGTAVNDWLDENGNPKYEDEDDYEAQEAQKEQIEKDKALNEELKKAAAAYKSEKY